MIIEVNRISNGEKIRVREGMIKKEPISVSLGIGTGNENGTRNASEAARAAGSGLKLKVESKLDSDEPTG
ncbi:hypothetical protein EVAR_3507_1 [Eumeta japonica]|uniref:Uncharacterized protein n=1 Tax=Eumeta variegata TaxID=151549 RepID=A0A4C1YYR3_EUMVA|nr:hypothetical protein EVAR_3507_1 [Eumeta japonica]